jgi:hypothetical protein
MQNNMLMKSYTPLTMLDRRSNRQARPAAQCQKPWFAAAAAADDAPREIRLVAAGSMAVARPLPVSYNFTSPTQCYRQLFVSRVHAEEKMHPSGVGKPMEEATEEDRDRGSWQGNTPPTQCAKDLLP